MDPPPLQPDLLLHSVHRCFSQAFFDLCDRQGINDWSLATFRGTPDKTGDLQLATTTACCSEMTSCCVAQSCRALQQLRQGTYRKVASRRLRLRPRCRGRCCKYDQRSWAPPCRCRAGRTVCHKLFVPAISWLAVSVMIRMSVG